MPAGLIGFGIVMALGIVDQQLFLPLGDGVGLGNGGEQSPGVGVEGMGEELLALGKLHQLSLVNHGDPVADEAHHGKVMGHKKIGQVPLLLQIGQQVQHLGPDGNVQGGYGLIGDDEVRLHDQRPGHADALALAAGKFMGEPAGKFRQQAHIGQGFFHLFPAFLPGYPVSAGVETLADDVVHLGPLVQGGHGVLENHLDPAGDLLVQLPGDAPVDLLAVKEDFSPGGGMDADDGPADGGLAGAGLSHQAEGLPLVDVEGYPVHRGKGMPPGAKANGQILNLHQFFSFLSQRGSLPSPAERGHAPAAPPWGPGGPKARCGQNGWGSPGRRAAGGQNRFSAPWDFWGQRRPL